MWPPPGIFTLYGLCTHWRKYLESVAMGCIFVAVRRPVFGPSFILYGLGGKPPPGHVGFTVRNEGGRVGGVGGNAGLGVSRVGLADMVGPGDMVGTGGTEGRALGTTGDSVGNDDGEAVGAVGKDDGAAVGWVD